MRIKDMTKEEAQVLIKWLGYPDAPAVSPAFVRALYRKAELPIPEHLQQKPLSNPDIIRKYVKKELFGTWE